MGPDGTGSSQPDSTPVCPIHSFHEKRRSDSFKRMTYSTFSRRPRPLPAAVSHHGNFISLHPQDAEKDAAELFRISHGTAEKDTLWQYLPVGPFPDEAALQAFLTQWGSNPDVAAFTVRSSPDGTAVGSISLMNLRPDHGVGELGNIWFTPSAQRTRANTESNYLLLRHCFGELGYRRMEWKCNALNEPSRRAALRLGFTYEGTFRQHMIVKEQNRDTAWFSMLDKEWAQVSCQLEGMLYV